MAAPMFLLLVGLVASVVASLDNKYVTIQLNSTQTEPFEIHVSARLDGGRKLCILCYPGQDRMWHKLWMKPQISVSKTDSTSTIDFYYGPNITDVLKQAETSTFLTWSPFLMLKEDHTFHPFNNSCLGISSVKSYTVIFVVKNADKWLVLCTMCGLLLFFLAAPLSRNVLLQYGTGVSLGILGSLLLVVFVISKVLPGKLKVVGYVLAAVSTSASMYLYQWIAYYFGDVVHNHWQLLLGYVVISGLVSFAVVYRHGPISNVRTLSLVKWALQLVGVLLIYSGTQITEVSVTIVLTAILAQFTVQFFSWNFLSSLKKYRSRFFRPKTRLLTEDEFIEEGEVETKKALEELRQFCQSPECNAWRTISRLTSPNKFASFIEGSFHLTDAEVETYNLQLTSFTNDDSESETDLSVTER